MFSLFQLCIIIAYKWKVLQSLRLNPFMFIEYCWNIYIMWYKVFQEDSWENLWKQTNWYKNLFCRFYWLSVQGFLFSEIFFYSKPTKCRILKLQTHICYVILLLEIYSHENVQLLQNGNSLNFENWNISNFENWNI